MLNIAIPMAGNGQRFKDAGYDTPKPFLPIGTRTMIEEVSFNLTPDAPHHKIFIHREEHTAKADILRAQNVSFVPVKETTDGAACTVLLAKDKINTEDPLLIANSDQLVDFDLHAFLDFPYRKGLDGLVLTFNATDPKWSYAKINRRHLVTEVAEKNPISRHATVGIYWYRHGSDFVRAAERMIAEDIRVNGEFYVCPVFNQLIAEGKRIGIYRIESIQMHGLGTPEDYERYLSEMGL